MRNVELITYAENYIKNHNLDLTVEELFKEFERVCTVYEEFTNYLNESGLIYKLNKMLRNKRLKERRSVFCKWYFTKYQNKPTKVLMIELSELTFMSERTVQEDTFCK